MSNITKATFAESLNFEEIPSPSHGSNSSPTRPTSYRINGGKETRAPSITPRKFTRFFTPRSHESVASGASRRVLFDITRPTNNRSGIQSSPIRPSSNGNGLENNPGFARDLKRRKLMHTPSHTPEEFSPVKSHDFVTSCISEDDSCTNDGICIGAPQMAESDPDDQSTQLSPGEGSASIRIQRLEDRSVYARLMQLSIGSGSKPRRQRSLYPVVGWQNETANFYSRPGDRHVVTSVTNPVDPCIPFCTTSCNTNSLVAVGDEEGRIRLLESAKGALPPFKDHYLTFRAHANAIIDMAFSNDDSLLATASGDQSASVIDMFTQQTISVLAAHTASVKQVKFQPGQANNSILATSARDGSVHIWDLRCKGTENPVMACTVPLDPVVSPGSSSRKNKVNYSIPVNSIMDAHKVALEGRMYPIISPYPASRGEPFGRFGDVSVTAMTFMPEGNEHLLLTASEANASIKLWDIRALHSSRRKMATANALSATALPRSHSSFRHFGISSIELNADASRLYTVCKDNTVYAYSTSHLILGSAPELSFTRQSRRRCQAEPKDGLGPLYGFQHPKLLVTSFYVKCAVRAARNGQAEMLAVGSSDGCAILFPTDEKYLPKRPRELDTTVSTTPIRRPPLMRSNSNVIDLDQADETLRFSENGTPLIRGHDREVGALSWTASGELITLGDDYVVRCWREGDDARDLRTGGEDEGRRWGCGWADVDPKLDDDE